MISIARTFGRARDGAGRQARQQRRQRILALAQLAHHVRDDVHDMAVALDDELFGRADRADLGHAAHIVAAKIKQHQMLGQFLLVGQKVGLKRAVFLGRGAARAGSGNRADRHLAVAQAHQDFGLAPTIWKPPKLKKNMKGEGLVRRRLR
jgi:hypothetical protein